MTAAIDQLTDDEKVFVSEMLVIQQEIALGYLTPDNIDEHALWVVTRYQLDRGQIEGRDWCWATNAQGAFGIYTLEPNSPALRDAVYHLWLRAGDRDDEDSDYIRRDYVDQGEYIEDAMEEAYASSYASRFD